MNVYQLKVTLRHIHPPIWRRIEVPANIKLDKLHRILQVAMGWTDSHMHAFRLGMEQYGAPSREFPNMFKSERTARLDQLVGKGDKLIYEYDFGDGWAHELTMLRVPVARVWPDIEHRPQPFPGSVTPINGATKAADTEEVQQTAQSPPNELPASSHSGLASNGDTEATGPVTSSIKVSVPGVCEPGDATNVAEATDPTDAGQQFLAWLKEGVATRRIQVNTVSARVHVVLEGVLLVSPGIFKDFAVHHPGLEWSNVQKRFQKLKLHRRTDGGTNIYRYSVVSARKRSSINGLLIPDAAVVFGASSPPPANPHLAHDPS